MAGYIRTASKFVGSALGLYTNYDELPPGIRWRSNKVFICTTVGVGMTVDIFLYSLIVPVMPFFLEQRIGIPEDQLQGITSGLLTAFAGASMFFSPFAGFIADQTKTRQAPFLCGLFAMFLGTTILFLAHSVPLLIVARVLQGASAAIVWTVGLALALDTVGPADLGKVIGTIFSFISFASLLAPTAGGALYSSFGYVGLFVVSAVALIVDFAMRLVVIERSSAAKYHGYAALSQNQDDTANSNVTEPSSENDGQAESQNNEETPLLPRGSTLDDYRIKPRDSWILNRVPLLYCFRNVSLGLAMLLSLIQAIMIGVFDSTVPTEAKDLFGFDSLRAGLLFVPLGVADLIFGPLFGWAVDRYGTKPLGVLGFSWLGPALISLRFAQPGGTRQIAIYCALLVLNGIGLSASGTPSIVESGAVVERFHRANPDLFGHNGPYGQLYGIGSMLFSGGLAVGPILAGLLRASIGYGNMSLVCGIICIVTSIACLFFLGGPLRLPRRGSSGDE